jgi:hypothetical protein
MDEWIGTKRESYLAGITTQDSQQGLYQCSSCSASSGPWRCKDCIGRRPLCRNCCRSHHRDLPFHRIEFWTGTHYERDWLANLGVVLHLGHHGECCPLRDPVKLPGDAQPDLESWNIYSPPSGFADTPVDCRVVTVAHTNGIHKVWVRLCSCREGGEDYQFLQLGFYPASYTRVETVFTFDLLDNCRLDNLECKASVYHMWSKLRRMTCPFFPTGVPVSGVPLNARMLISYNNMFCPSQNRHQELFRVLRQWRNLKQRKWSGQLYREDISTVPGSLALFCATCPQPGENLPENWHEDPEAHAYIRSFAMDGNFSAVHQKRSNATPEQCLTDGELYMVAEKRYQAHLASTVECKEVGRIITRQDCPDTLICLNLSAYHLQPTSRGKRSI